MAVLLMLVSCLAYSSTLKMVATCSPETPVNFQPITWLYISKELFIFPTLLLLLFFFKKESTSSVGNYKTPLLFSTIFPKLFNLSYMTMFYRFKSKLNPSQYGIFKYTVINLVTFLDFVTHLVCSQGQTDSILILAMPSIFFHMHYFIKNSVTMVYLPVI
jgi:hypothetical protein